MAAFFIKKLTMLENYIKYLNFLDGKLSKFFTEQKPYIFCKEGCSRCCKHAQFPYTSIEMTYLLTGLLNLDKKTRNIVTQNVVKILEEESSFEGEKFRYDCPFLIQDSCSVYQYRGILCRTFGLPAQANDGALLMPFCCYEGLNYSNVFDIDKNKVSEVKVKAVNSEFEPCGFNISYEYLTNPDIGREFNFSFGERKPLIYWFKQKGKY